jgi:hypothetical protein
LRHPDGEHDGPLPFAEMVRRIVTGQLAEGTKVRRDRGDFESAGRMPELRRYLDSKALQWGPSGPPEGASRRGVLYGGRLLSHRFWRDFAEIPNVWAIKIAPFNRYQTIDVVRSVVEAGRDDIARYTGNDDNIVADLVTPFPVHVGRAQTLR